MEKGVLLISGGIDSPVAGHLMGREGLEIIALHFSLEPFTDSAPEEKSRRIASLLGFPRLYICNIGEALTAIARNCQHRYYFVLSKRLMYRLAETLAAEERARFLITGESLGQVSSQTLANLRVIDASVEISVLRPLIGWDKVEIMETARKLRSYEISEGAEVCDVLGPSHPATQAKLEVVELEEGRLRYEDLLTVSLKTMRLVHPPPLETTTTGEG